VIAEAILRGLLDPATLPDPYKKPDGAFAAPGLAAMIHAASRGDTQTLVALSHMAEQMSRAGGEMARLAGLVRRLLNGERNAAALERGLSVRTRQLLHGILEELGRLDRH
jgi:hypothetical protein